MSKKSTSPQDRVNTTAHLIETTAHHLGHTKRHAEKLHTAKSKPERDFNQAHLDTHLDGGIEHIQKLMDHVKNNYPAEGKELSKLENTVPRSAVKQRIHDAVKKRIK